MRQPRHAGFAKNPNAEMFAGSWIKGECDRQNVPFHQAQLSKLVRAGSLAKDYSARRGSRRYYRLANRSAGTAPNGKPDVANPQ